MKTINVLALCLIVILIGSISCAQKSTTPSTNSKSEPETKPVTKSEPETKPVTKGKIDIEAGVVFKSGDVKPVARNVFYLLKNNAEKVILTQEHLNLFNQDHVRQFASSKPKTLSQWSMYEAVLYMDGRITPNFATAAKKSLESSKIASTTTGFDGKATLEEVDVGDYYLFGYYNASDTAYWNIPVSVKAGSNKVILGNDNFGQQ
jgi:hypothetical protein